MNHSSITINFESSAQCSSCIGDAAAGQPYGPSFMWLAAGQDRAFRMFSTIQDQQSRELSQGHSSHRAKRLKVSEQDVKLPPVLSMDACQVCHSALNRLVPCVKALNTGFCKRS